MQNSVINSGKVKKMCASEMASMWFVKLLVCGHECLVFRIA